MVNTYIIEYLLWARAQVKCLHSKKFRYFPTTTTQQHCFNRRYHHQEPSPICHYKFIVCKCILAGFLTLVYTLTLPLLHIKTEYFIRCLIIINNVLWFWLFEKKKLLRQYHQRSVRWCGVGVLLQLFLRYKFIVKNISNISSSKTQLIQILNLNTEQKNKFKWRNVNNYVKNVQ